MASKFLRLNGVTGIGKLCGRPEILIPYLPTNEELGHWNGKHYLSLVGFRFIMPGSKEYRFHSTGISKKLISVFMCGIRLIQVGEEESHLSGDCSEATLTFIANSIFREST
jgi:hypothetical protein